jgi:cytochrome c553
MSRETGPFKTHSPWPKIGWGIATVLIVVSFALGFLVVSPAQQGGPTLGVWAAICRGLGLTSDTRAALEGRPRLLTPSRIAWTPQTLAVVSRGDITHWAFVALNCMACHGEGGVSRSDLYPTLAGMEAVTIFKLLDDFRSGKRSNGVMNAIATALTPENSADVAAFFASRPEGMPAPTGQSLQGGNTLHEENIAVRLIFAGDPGRGIPPCTSCHGPSDIKLGAPRLSGQQPLYIERQLAAFAQGLRQNDINEQMRTVAAELTSPEMHALAQFYGAGATHRTGGQSTAPTQPNAGLNKVVAGLTYPGGKR